MNNLLVRHMQVEDNVKPRVRGRFEPAARTLPSPFAQDVGTGSAGTSWPDQQEEPHAEQPSARSTGNLPAGPPPVPGALAPTNLRGVSASEWEQETERRPLEAAIPTRNAFEATTSLSGNSQPNLVSISPDAPQEINKLPQAAALNPKRHNQDLVEPALRAKSDAEASRATPLDGLLGGPAHLPSTQRTGNPNGREQAPAASLAPTIKVTIGRIEVRAVSAPAPATAQPAASPKPLLSLDEYLKRRNTRRGE